MLHLVACLLIFSVVIFSFVKLVYMLAAFFKIRKQQTCLLFSIIKMPPKKQIIDTKVKNITAFFSKSIKRASNEECNGSNKIQKLNNENVVASPISPEQRERMKKNKDAATEKLLEQRTVKLDIGESWNSLLKEEFAKPYYIKLEKFVSAERARATVYPTETDVFSWTRFGKINDVKVVIIGQDPYHGPNQAHGLCFSVQVGVRIPPSLLNMYKELETDIESFQRPKHGYLVGWAQQGVLLLNAVLTVQAGKPNSHKERGWETLTDATIKWINRNLDGVVFMLWGSYAQKKGSFINNKKHCVLKGVHPSPLSASRGYFGCKHFSKANDYLKENGKEEIDWTFLPESL